MTVPENLPPVLANKPQSEWTTADWRLYAHWQSTEGALRPTAEAPSSDFQALIDALLEEAETTTTVSTTVTTGRGRTTGRTISRDVSFTEQISRRYFDVPTAEQFMNQFENAYGGYLKNMRAAGLAPADINLALDPATGLMDVLMSEYTGELAARMARGEDIYELVGTEADFRFIRREPGTESVTLGRGEQVSEQVSTDVSTSTGETVAEGEAAPTSTSKSTSEQVGTSRFESESTEERHFREVTDVYSRPEIFAVFKFSPTEFLESRFKDAGEMATYLRSRKGERPRQRETLTGGPVVTPRRV